MITYAPFDKPVLRPPVESAQYMSHDYRKLVVGYGMVQSVGRTGVCWDNSVAESAWSSLKRELVHRYRFATRADARRAIFAWINRYNSRRRSLGGPGPVARCCIEAPSDGLCNRYPRLWCMWLLRMAALAGSGVDGERLVFGDVG